MKQRTEAHQRPGSLRSRHAEQKDRAVRARLANAGGIQRLALLEQKLRSRMRPEERAEGVGRELRALLVEKHDGDRLFGRHAIHTQGDFFRRIHRRERVEKNRIGGIQRTLVADPDAQGHFTQSKSTHDHEGREKNTPGPTPRAVTGAFHLGGGDAVAHGL